MSKSVVAAFAVLLALIGAAQARSPTATELGLPDYVKISDFKAISSLEGIKVRGFSWKATVKKTSDRTTVICSGGRPSVTTDILGSQMSETVLIDIQQLDPSRADAQDYATWKKLCMR